MGLMCAHASLNTVSGLSSLSTISICLTATSKKTKTKRHQPQSHITLKTGTTDIYNNM